MKLWRKIDRIAAWVLLIGMVLYFITGYGMSKGIIDAEFATRVHADVLPIIVGIAFLVHAGYATRLALIRWKIWRLPIAKIAWSTFFILFFFVSIFFLDRVYQVPTNGNSTILVEASVTDPLSSPTPSASPSPSQAPVQTLLPEPSPSPLPSDTLAIERTFTLTELAQYDGRDGNPAYAAVDGVVYDITRVFRNGFHFSHGAGQDLSNVFYLRHAKSAITKYPVVGILAS
jgi:membrane-associated progesterone receptor component